MTKKIYYEKVGRRYVPVAEYDNEFMDSFTKGNHLVMCYPGGSSRRFNIQPDYAALIAAPDREEADRAIDLRRKQPQLLAFTEVRPGMRVLDMGAGGGQLPGNEVANAARCAGDDRNAAGKVESHA